jgi:uncharacterized protein (TIGR02145 family)
VRAYAIRSEGTAYGNEVSFTTAINLPTLITLPASSITASSAYSGGDVLTHGGTEVMQRGVVWSTAINPTLDNNFTVNGSGMGIYPSNLVDLIANTVYYIRAYAINEAGIAYGNELSFTTQSNSGEINSWLNPNKNYGTLIDQSGNTYATIFIGGQEWMAENLRTSSYSNGEPIPNVTSSSAWDQLNTGAWVHYNNESQNEVPFGKLYNWYTVADPRNVCPSGWHVPSDAEWSTLINYMDPNADGGDNWNSAGGKLKSTDLQYWNSPNTNATNESGFSALPGGYRGNYGNFYYFVHSYHWSSSAINTSSAYLRILHYDTGTANRGFVNKKYGYSVRCLRD